MVLFGFRRFQIGLNTWALLCSTEVWSPHQSHSLAFLLKTGQRWYFHCNTFWQADRQQTKVSYLSYLKIFLVLVNILHCIVIQLLARLNNDITESINSIIVLRLTYTWGILKWLLVVMTCILQISKWMLECVFKDQFYDRWRAIHSFLGWSISVACIQWIISELACYTYSMVAVPLYDTLGPEALVFIINRGN